MGEMRYAKNIYIRKREGKRPLGKYWGRWEDNIEMDLKETGCEDADWVRFPHEKWVLVNKNLRVP
jgi:hypothetical protein